MSRKLYPEGIARLYVPLQPETFGLLDEVATELNTTAGRLVANFLTEQMDAFRVLLETVRSAKKSTDLSPLRALLEAKAQEAQALAGTINKAKK